MKLLFAAILVTVALSPTATLAAGPEHPGFFGTYRADVIHDYIAAGTPDRWGNKASTRAGTNGDRNQEWRDDHPESKPTPGAPQQ